MNDLCITIRDLEKNAKFSRVEYPISTFTADTLTNTAIQDIAESVRLRTIRILTEARLAATKS